MSEWKEYKLGDLANIQTGPFGSQLHASDYIPIGIPSIMPTNIGTRLNLNTENVANISEYDANRLAKYRVRQGDIVYSRRGDVEKCAFITKNEAGWLCGTGCLIVRINSELLNPKFCAYYLSTDEMKAWISSNAVGTTMPNLNTSILQKLPLSCPSYTQQTAIASLLSSLDDKIDLLHRQNATLEKMAETLFRQWFVEEAKEEWETMPLSKMANFLNGLACQKFPPKNEVDKLPVLKIKELSSGITENSDWASTDIKPEYIVKNSDIIFAWSASLMVKIWNGQDCILNQHLFKVTSEYYPKWFYYLWCKHHLAEFISIAASHATTMGHIKRGDLDEAIVLIPSVEELDAMTQQVEPLIEKVITNTTQIRTLTALRDTLLPKLMSGEVRVQL